jgi:hypothetical protein
MFGHMCGDHWLCAVSARPGGAVVPGSYGDQYEFLYP